MKRLRSYYRATLVALGLAACGGVGAGTAAGQFGITITLQPQAVTCTSTSQNQPSNVVLRVYCSAGQYVLVQSFVGTQSRLHRYYFGNDSHQLSAAGADDEDALALLGAGTVTAWRTYLASKSGKSVELLVSF